MPRSGIDIAAARRKIVSFIRAKVEAARADGAVVGLSGGIDSAVVAYLTVEAIGSRRVLGLMMPDLRVTPEDDIGDARTVAEELCLETKHVDIAPIHRAFMKSMEPERVAEGNLRARIRMSLLYYIANSTNRLVVGTGDRSEMSVGYYTKWGDGGVDLLPIGDLYKGEVRTMGEVLGVSRRIISKRSSPRLWAGQIAEDELGADYDVIDAVLELRGAKSATPKAIASKLGVSPEVVGGILRRRELTAHKRELPEICRVR